MKRTIPRDRHEFDEFLGPLVEARQWDTPHERLISYWRRKGRSSLSAMVVSPWVVLASVKGAVRIDVRFLNRIDKACRKMCQLNPDFEVNWTCYLIVQPATSMARLNHRTPHPQTKSPARGEASFGLLHLDLNQGPSD